MLYRAYMMDSEIEGHRMQAQTYLKMFAQDLNLKWQVDKVFHPATKGQAQL